MNETKKTEHSLPLSLKVWLAFFTGIVLVMTFIGLTSAEPRELFLKPMSFLQKVIIYGVAGASLLAGLLLLVQWVNCWRNLRRALIGLAIFITLITVFYTEENWRGKRDWENCRRDLEAKGVVLDWDKYIPPTLPDDQNFYTASTNIALRFVKARTDAQMEAASQLQWLRLGPTGSNSFAIFNSSTSGPVVVAELNILSGDEISSVSAKHQPVPKISDADVSERIGNWIKDAVGESIEGSQGFKFSQRQLKTLLPESIFLQADTLPSASDLKKMIPANIVTNIGSIRVLATPDKKSFQIQLDARPITSAEDYLKWSDQYVSAFDEVREALKRPYAIIPGDYSVPYLQPIPNFVTLRMAAQTLAQRAQCDFLLGRPEDALREVTLMHDMCRILEKPPTGKPLTLVEAMINVAISGLYTTTVAEGFRLDVWHESQIAVLQAQFKEINLVSTVYDSFVSERAASTHTLAMTPASKIAELFNMVDVVSAKNKPSFWKTLNQRLTDPMYLFLRLCPRGWIYQNMITTASHVRSEDGVDLGRETISPQFFEQVNHDLNKSANHVTPFNVWARIATPNFTKAWQVTAHNQTLVNEAQVVCALERYHLAHENYPETLDALAPQFMEKIPHDIIGGDPLIYRPTFDGKFLLYSIGWNEKDDGGLEASDKTSNGGIDYAKGDWVWKN
jgi:hypothetical protein